MNDPWSPDLSSGGWTLVSVGKMTPLWTTQESKACVLMARDGEFWTEPRTCLMRYGVEGHGVAATHLSQSAVLHTVDTILSISYRVLWILPVYLRSPEYFDT